MVPAVDHSNQDKTALSFCFFDPGHNNSLLIPCVDQLFTLRADPCPRLKTAHLPCAWICPLMILFTISSFTFSPIGMPFRSKWKELLFFCFCLLGSSSSESLDWLTEALLYPQNCSYVIIIIMEFIFVRSIEIHQASNIRSFHSSERLTMASNSH